MRHMLRAGQALFLCAIALLLLGVLMVNSAGLSVASDTPITLMGLLTGRTAMLALCALGAMIIGSRFPVRILYEWRGARSPVLWLIPLLIILLLLIHVPGIGREVNGAKRWLMIGPLGFQPSELAKWGMIVVLAWFAIRKAGVLHSLRHGFLPPVLLLGLICALIATEDLGTAVLIGGVGIAMLVAAGARLRHAALLLPVAAAGFIAAVIASPYRINRLKAFLHPYDDPQGVGYHIIQSLASVSGGGVAGRGLGNSVQKFGYLPEDTTDFIFAIITEELGVVGAVVVVSLYVAILLFGWSIIRRTESPFARLLGLGILLTLGFQAMINMMVVTGMAPTKGIALPLISSGGTGWIMTAFFLGLLWSIDRRNARTGVPEVDDPHRSLCDHLAVRIDDPENALPTAIS